MSQIDQEPTGSQPPTTTTSQPPPQPPVDDDPLSHLHKMSTTAGLGSGDYVAVNGTAVFSLILGLASALVLLSGWFLVFAVVGVVAAIVAFVQIRDSNATQTARALAVFGLLLCLGFGGFLVTRWVTDEYRTRSDRAAIATVITQLGDAMKSGDGQAAYGLFTDTFHQRVPQQPFEERLKVLRENPSYGKLQGTKTNGLVDFQTDESTGARYGIALVELVVERAREDVQLADDGTFRKVGDEWRIEALPKLFPPLQQRPAGRP
jgi:hypothetical protein